MSVIHNVKMTFTVHFIHHKKFSSLQKTLDNKKPPTEQAVLADIHFVHTNIT